jgi:orotate phosphoribosyltransferase
MTEGKTGNILTIVDRLEGAGAALQAEGVSLSALLTVKDFL